MLAKGWRQADLVKASGLPRDSISTYMLGKTLPEKENLKAIATALGVEPKDLIPTYVEVIDEGAESPFEMKVNGKDASKTWIRVATTVSSVTARKIFELIQLDAEQPNGN
jgi:transcriptional regulator with XRE-family HTH domain